MEKCDGKYNMATPSDCFICSKVKCKHRKEESGCIPIIAIPAIILIIIIIIFC
jgi:hypothetical protein